MSSASFALRFCRLSALVFKRSASKDRIPFFTACLQTVLFSASSCQVSVSVTRYIKRTYMYRQKIIQVGQVFNFKIGFTTVKVQMRPGIWDRCVN